MLRYIVPCRNIQPWLTTRIKILANARTPSLAIEVERVLTLALLGRKIKYLYKFKCLISGPDTGLKDEDTYIFKFVVLNCWYISTGTI